MEAEVFLHSLEGLTAEDREAKILEEFDQSKALIAAARQDVNIFTELVLRDENTGEHVKQSHIHQKWQEIANLYPSVVIWSHPEGGKCLCIHTLTATPTGWKELKDIATGDEVMGRDGRPTKVTWVSPVQNNLKTYRLTFDDQTTIDACEDHQWLAKNKADKRAGRGWQIVNTKTMYQTQREYASKQTNWSIPLTQAVEYAEQDLPIDPYVLGVWLGGGNSRNTRITISRRDKQLYNLLNERIECGPLHEATPSAYRTTIGVKKPGSDGLHATLSKQGLLHNKHIPTRYLTSSVRQREDLLAGLLDTDGTVVKGSARVSFSSTNKDIAGDVVELARSLGYKVSVREDNQYDSICYKVELNTHHGDIFRLDRKMDILRDGRALSKICTRALDRKVVNIEPVESRPMLCIAVDNGDKSYIVSKDYIVTHNTQQFAIARTLWLLGHNPRTRCAILSETYSRATKIVGAISSHIVDNQVLKAIFPNLKKGRKWTDTQIYVDRPMGIIEPSVQAVGTMGSLQGARLDYLVVDDILTQKNTLTAHQRDAIKTWVQSSAYSRLTEDSRVIFLANAWHPDDLAHEHARTPGWYGERFTVLDENGKPTWPERFPMSRIELIKSRLSSAEFERQYMCQAFDETSARFKKEWIERIQDPHVDFIESVEDIMRNDHSFDYNEYSVHKSLIRGTTPEQYLREQGFKIVTGVDLAVQKHDAADWTVLTTVLEYPDTAEWGELARKRQILDIDRSRMSAPEIIKKIIEVHDRYCSMMVIENVAAQDYIVQFLKESHNVPIRPFTTGRQKVHPEFGVATIAAELEHGRWIFPYHNNELRPEMAQLVQELLYYDPQGHTGDCLMSMWFAREGLREMDRFKAHHRYEDDGGVMIIGDKEPEEIEEVEFL